MFLTPKKTLEEAVKIQTKTGKDIFSLSEARGFKSTQAMAISEDFNRGEESHNKIIYKHPFEMEDSAIQVGLWLNLSLVDTALKRIKAVGRLV